MPPCTNDCPIKFLSVQFFEWPYLIARGSPARYSDFTDDNDANFAGWARSRLGAGNGLRVGGRGSGVY